MKLLDHMVALALIVFFFFFSFNSFEEFPFWFPSCCASLPSYQQCTRVPFSPHLCPCLFFLVLLMMANLTGVKRCLSVVFIYIFLIISDVEHLFMCPLTTCISPLEKCLCDSSSHFQLSCSFWLEKRVTGSLRVLTLKLLPAAWYVNVSSRSISWLSVLLMVLFGFTWEATFSKRKEISKIRVKIKEIKTKKMIYQEKKRERTQNQNFKWERRRYNWYIQRIIKTTTSI